MDFVGQAVIDTMGRFIEILLMPTLIFGILLSFFVSASVLAAGEGSDRAQSRELRKELKQGFSFALGANQSTYTLVQNFQGLTKQFSSEEIDLYGPVLNLGYDLLWGSWFVTGLRIEGFYLETFKQGNTETASYTSEVTGGLTGGQVSLRLGKVFGIKTKQLILDQLTELLGEFFFEGGVGQGAASLNNEYKYSAGSTTESYNINVKERYRSRLIGVGFTLMNLSGGFMEFKFSQASVLNNEVRISEKSLLSTGGADTNQFSYSNLESSPIYLSTVLIGYHW